jgi:hypothetical protein
LKLFFLNKNHQIELKVEFLIYNGNCYLFILCFGNTAVFFTEGPALPNTSPPSHDPGFLAIFENSPIVSCYYLGLGLGPQSSCLCHPGAGITESTNRAGFLLGG